MTLARSFELARRAEKFDAFAAKRNNQIAADQMIEGEYPVFVERASGAYLWDVDGNRYLDFFLSYGTIGLGHADPDVDGSAAAEIGSGFATGLMKPVRLDLVEELVDTVPGADMAMLLKTGSDATGAAVRLARSFTGRQRIMRWGYNGWHDWCAEWSRGIPSASRELVHSFPYNDLEALRALFERHPGEFACLIMMPFLLEPPAPGYLAGVRDLTREHGTLLIFDEMRSGFRIAIGGAQEYFGVDADLVTFGKAFANGYAISALTGRADVMRHLDHVHISSTFYANSDAMAAALATIRKLRSGTYLEHIRAMGDRLQEGLRELADDFDAPVDVVGHPTMPYLEFLLADENQSSAAKQSFYTATVRAGVLFHPNHHWFVCAATTKDDIDFALDAARDGFTALRHDGHAGARVLRRPGMALRWPDSERD
jgi:glutamate-1-semialdehyde 2,1-aminomutase